MKENIQFSITLVPIVLWMSGKAGGSGGKRGEEGGGGKGRRLIPT